MVGLRKTKGAKQFIRKACTESYPLQKLLKFMMFEIGYLDLLLFFVFFVSLDDFHMYPAFLSAGLLIHTWLS